MGWFKKRATAREVGLQLARMCCDRSLAELKPPEHLSAKHYADEVRCLVAFAIDFGVSGALGANSPTRNAVLDEFWAALRFVVVDEAAWEGVKRRIVLYTGALGDAPYLGLAYAVGRLFDRVCQTGGDLAHAEAMGKVFMEFTDIAADTVRQYRISCG